MEKKNSLAFEYGNLEEPERITLLRIDANRKRDELVVKIKLLQELEVALQSCHQKAHSLTMFQTYSFTRRRNIYLECEEFVNLYSSMEFLIQSENQRKYGTSHPDVMETMFNEALASSKRDLLELQKQLGEHEKNYWLLWFF